MTDINTSFIMLIKHQLDTISKIIELEENGQPVTIDEVRLDLNPVVRKNSHPTKKNKPEKSVKYEKLLAFRSQEPRLIMINRFLSGLMRFARFYSNGKTVTIDGFRLKNLDYWAKYACDDVYNNLGELCSACNCDCDLCFLKGSVIDFPKKSVLSLSETRTRIKYYQKEKKLGLPMGNTLPGEPFLNPKVLDILKMARDVQPDTNISITTNGELLSESLIRELARLKPIVLVISLNSADPENRRKIMKSKRAAQMIEAISLLKEYGIQFSGSILTPADLPLSDLENTARFLNRNKAIIIRIPLPGFTRFHPFERQFVTKERWDGIVDMVDRLRKELITPFLVCPSFYWNRNIAAHVDGVFANSPAMRAGLKFGNRIVEIDGQKVITKVDADHLLSSVTENAIRSVQFQRGQEIHEIQLNNDASIRDDCYPFKPAGYPVGSGYMGKQYGLHFINGFHLNDAIEVVNIIKQHPKAKKVLIFTTPLVKNLFAQAVMIIQKKPEFSLNGIQIQVTMAEHRFWGGNIVVGARHDGQPLFNRRQQAAVEPISPIGWPRRTRNLVPARRPGQRETEVFRRHPPRRARSQRQRGPAPAPPLRLRRVTKPFAKAALLR